MKIFNGSLVLIIALIIISGCSGKGRRNNDSQSANDTITIPDTGYTGIKKYMSSQRLFKEVTFKNGMRHGLMKTFYADGKVRVTYWYENDLREDSSRWYFQEGQLFRTTPYKRDTIDGIQKQFYRTGQLKAKIGYKKGLRTPYIEEFTQEGKLVGGYPELIVNVRDEYQSKGLYSISLELSDKSMKVKYFEGDFSKGVFDTAHCKPVNTLKGIGSLNLKKTGSPKKSYVGVIAEVLTNFGNNYLIYKKIDLPYNDLK